MMSAPRRENQRAGSVDAVLVRRMRWWDIAPVAALEGELFPHDGWTVETFWSELAGVPETRYYVAAESLDGEIVGYAGLFAARDQADVQTLGVRLDHQRTGLGRRMLNSLLDEAGRRGCREVFLEVREENTAAIRLYERTGFEVAGRRRGYYGRGADAIVMRCRLPPRTDPATAAAP